MAIAQQDATQNKDFSVAATTFTSASYTVSATAATTILVVLIGLEGNGTGAGTISSVTWNGGAQALTILDQTAPANWSRCGIAYVLNPTATTSTVAVSTTGVTNCKASFSILSFTGVDSATPWRAVSKSTGTSNTSTTTGAVASAASGDYFLDAICIDGTGHSLAAGADQTAEINSEGSTGSAIGGSRQTTLSDAKMSWSWTTAAPYSHVSCAMIPSGGGGGGATIKALAALGVG